MELWPPGRLRPEYYSNSWVDVLYSTIIVWPLNYSPFSTITVGALYTFRGCIHKAKKKGENDQYPCCIYTLMWWCMALMVYIYT